MPFQGLGVAKWKTATQKSQTNKGYSFPTAHPQSCKVTTPLFFSPSSFFSLGFVLELFHVFPVELFLLLAYGDQMVTHDDSNPEKCQSSPQHGQNPSARLSAAGQELEQSVTEQTQFIPVCASLPSQVAWQL